MQLCVLLMTVTDELSTLFVEVWEQKKQLPLFTPRMLTKVKCKLLKKSNRNEELLRILYNNRRFDYKSHGVRVVFGDLYSLHIT